MFECSIGWSSLVGRYGRWIVVFCALRVQRVVVGLWGASIAGSCREAVILKCVSPGVFGAFRNCGVGGWGCGAGCWGKLSRVGGERRGNGRGEKKGGSVVAWGV
jgi:hypothetical protein